MLNRRLIRVKVFQALYAHNQDDAPSLNRNQKTYLKDSVDGIYQNFRTVFIFPLELVHYIRTTQNPEDNRYLKDDVSSRVYRALSLHGLYEYLVQQPNIESAMSRPAHAWQKDTELLHTIYRKIVSEAFTEKLIAIDQPTFADQVKFLSKLFEYLMESETFNQAMEEVEMLWEDEKIPVFKFVRSVVKEIREDVETKLPRPDDKNDESREFAIELLVQTVNHQEEHIKMIDDNSPGWERDRIAKTDLTIMSMAITELLYFPYIPVKVTLNEYLELAKNYSTPQSSKFVNGVLDKLVKEFKESNKLVKKGRGMIGS